MYSMRLPTKSVLRRKKTLDTGTEGGASQEFGEKTEINYLVKQHLRTGTPFPLDNGQFADVSEIPGIQERLEAIGKGKDAYHRLPNKVKNHYRTMEDFLNAVEDPEQRDLLVHLGVFKNKAQEVPPSKPAKPEGAAETSGGGTASGGA